MLLGPVTNWMSRRHERRADQYALEVTGNPGALASGLPVWPRSVSRRSDRHASSNGCSTRIRHTLRPLGGGAPGQPSRLVLCVLAPDGILVSAVA